MSLADSPNWFDYSTKSLIKKNKRKFTVQSKLAILASLVIIVGLVGSAYAHKAQVVGDYKIEAGWKNEPPIVGKKNAIEITVTKASSTDKKASDHESHDDKAKNKKKTSYEKTSASIHSVSSTKKDSEHKADKKSTHDHKTKKSVGVTGLAKTLEADVTLNGKKTFLKLVEDQKKKGTYYGDYTPESVGYPTVHIVGKIKNTPIEVTFHVEKVEPKK